MATMGSPHPLGVSTGPGWKLSPFVFIIFLPKIETIRLFIRDQYSHLPINTCNNVRHVLLHYRNKFSRRQNVHFQSVKSPHLPIQVEDLGGPDVALEAVRVTRGHRQDQQLWKKKLTTAAKNFSRWRHFKDFFSTVKFFPFHTFYLLEGQ